MMCFVTKATPNHNIDRKYNTKKHSFISQLFMVLEADTHTHTHAHRHTRTHTYTHTHARMNTDFADKSNFKKPGTF